jgi:hypothetical protein
MMKDKSTKNLNKNIPSFFYLSIPTCLGLELRSPKELRNPSIVIMTDHTDLDEQI